MSDAKPEYTSERVSEVLYQSTPQDYLVWCMHVATYEFARPLVAGGSVLDFGCGTGYGAKRLAPDVRDITGIDISQDAIAEARAGAVPPNTEFRRIPPIEDEPLPWDDDTFDSVVSFQVIEHLPAIPVYLREIRRVLRPGGVFVCATPDRTRRLLPRQRPWNVFHLIEFTPDEMEDMMRSTFDEVELYGMVGEPRSIMDLEFDRYRRLRYLTLPFTFPGAPEGWRRRGLEGLKRLQGRERDGDSRDTADFGFGPDDIRMVRDETGTTNIVTVAR